MIFFKVKGINMLCCKEGPYYYGLWAFTTSRWSSNAESRIEKPIFHKWYSLWQPQQETSGKGKLSSGGQGATSCTNIQNHQIHAPGKIMFTTSLLFYDWIEYGVCKENILLLLYYCTIRKLSYHELYQYGAGWQCGTISSFDNLNILFNFSK